MIDHSVLERYFVKVAREDAWQQRARLLQSLWRERKGLDPGPYNETQLGSSLRIEDGGPPALAGFLSDAAKDQVTTAVDESKASGAGAGGSGFLGIEVKYHENLKGKAATDKAHYADIAARHGAFRDGALPLLRKLPLQQIWLDHLLALQLLASDRHPYVEGMFVLLSPVGNHACTAAVEKYRECLTGTRTFDARRLEEIVQALRMTTSAPWVEELHDRYFGVLPEV